jgi:hypothetical protein
MNLDDPWKPTSYRPVRALFGSKHDFSWYFEGVSNVEVTNAEDVFAWLLECEYMSDEELFHESDFWQHPTTFETTRSGDCEDHALWAWRKLTELGLKADFYVGNIRSKDGSLQGGEHAWVVFDRDGERFILEAAVKTREKMVRRLSDVREHYVPTASVGARFQTTSYCGYFVTLAADFNRG